MLNYVTNRFEEFSSEIKQTANMPSINEFVQAPVMSQEDLTSINRVANDTLTQTIASKQSMDIKRFEKQTKRLKNSIDFLPSIDHHQHFQRKSFVCVHRY